MVLWWCGVLWAPSGLPVILAVSVVLVGTVMVWGLMVEALVVLSAGGKHTVESVGCRRVAGVYCFSSSTFCCAEWFCHWSPFGPGICGIGVPLQ